MGSAAFVRPHAVLVFAIPKKPKGGRNAAQNRRWQGPAKSKQYLCLARTAACCRATCEAAYRQVGNHVCDGVECCPDRSDTTPQPTDGTGQGNVRPSQPVSRGLNALRGQCHGNAVFNRGEQARLSCGEEIRKQAECLVTHRAIPPGNTQPSRGYPSIAAMAGK